MNYVILIILNVTDAVIFYFMYYAFVENGQMNFFKMFFIAKIILSGSSLGIYFTLTSRHVSAFFEKHVSQANIEGLPLRPKVAIIICSLIAMPCALIALFLYPIYGTIDLWVLRGEW